MQKKLVGNLSGYVSFGLQTQLDEGGYTLVLGSLISDETTNRLCRSDQQPVYFVSQQKFSLHYVDMSKVAILLRNQYKAQITTDY